MLDVQDIWKLLPHRYPFLLVDRVLEMPSNESIVALKNVTVNEPIFTGIFRRRQCFLACFWLKPLLRQLGYSPFTRETDPLMMGTSIILREPIRLNSNEALFLAIRCD